MTATILNVLASTMMISSLYTKYLKPRHSGCISIRVRGTPTMRTVRGMTVPTLIEKLTLDTRGALLPLSTVSRILVRWSVVSVTEVPPPTSRWPCC